MKIDTWIGNRTFRSAIARLLATGSTILAIALSVAPDANSAVSFKITRTTPVHLGSSMRVIVVRPAACREACPEWISAEGQIAPETAAEFRRVLASIGNRRLPVFINSIGGNVEASLAIGRLLRARRLPVSVTRTWLEACPSGIATCSRTSDAGIYFGTASSYGAICASACAFLIAGGERRYVSPGSLVGVHEIAIVLRPLMTDITLTTTDASGRKIEVGQKRILILPPKITDLPQFTQDKLATAIAKYRGTIAGYYREMGMSDDLITLAFATKPPAIHWMTPSELSQTRLMSDAVGGEALVGFSPTQATFAPPASAVVAPAYVTLGQSRPGKS
jgi:hypothetical protein